MHQHKDRGSGGGGGGGGDGAAMHPPNQMPRAKAYQMSPLSTKHMQIFFYEQLLYCHQNDAGYDTL